jgi:hypothetical protein
MRQLWLAYIAGHDGETCGDCGRDYVHWYAADDLYGQVTDHWPTPWTDGSSRAEPAGGLFCPACFDRRARKRGIRLLWVPERLELKDAAK